MENINIKEFFRYPSVSLFFLLIVLFFPENSLECNFLGVKIVITGLFGVFLFSILAWCSLILCIQERYNNPKKQKQNMLVYFSLKGIKDLSNIEYIKYINPPTWYNPRTYKYRCNQEWDQNCWMLQHMNVKNDLIWFYTDNYNLEIPNIITDSNIDVSYVNSGHLSYVNIENKNERLSLEIHFYEWEWQKRINKFKWYILNPFYFEQGISALLIVIDFYLLVTLFLWKQ